MRIAIFSGSFNPVHNGHLEIARAVLKKGIADELWFLVSPQNPLKQDSNLLPQIDRLKMAKLAIENEEGMKVSDFEFHLPRPSFTIRTLEKLKTTWPENQFSLLIGGDNLTIIHKWIEYERIISEFGLIVYPRPGFEVQDSLNYTNIIFINEQLINISATLIRKKLAKGESISELVPEKVEEYLKNLSVPFKYLQSDQERDCSDKG